MGELLVKCLLSPSTVGVQVAEVATTIKDSVNDEGMANECEQRLKSQFKISNGRKREKEEPEDGMRYTREDNCDIRSEESEQASKNEDERIKVKERL
ncbi:hypothetical protein EVAR_67947_1 [Eumeta japonica]|uniref:Uncharacterized protein n=1 Tax=Eumeta variegata TaxID=151549 RepID=A0A4C2A2D6_EUMVA|nr:hypothetical protein EVAR_67947_1 [Eumeta japonica]